MYCKGTRKSTTQQFLHYEGLKFYKCMWLKKFELPNENLNLNSHYHSLLHFHWASVTSIFLKMVIRTGYWSLQYISFRFILFTNCINTIHWLAFVPLYLASTDHMIKGVILAYSLSLSGIYILSNKDENIHKSESQHNIK